MGEAGSGVCVVGVGENCISQFFVTVLFWVTSKVGCQDLTAYGTMR